MNLGEFQRYFKTEGNVFKGSLRVFKGVPRVPQEVCRCSKMFKESFKKIVSVFQGRSKSVSKEL